MCLLLYPSSLVAQGNFFNSYNLNGGTFGLAAEVHPDPFSPSSSVYLFGGSVNSTVSNACYTSPVSSWGRSNNTAPLWTPIMPMSAARMGHKAISGTLGGIPVIYVMGGFNFTYVSLIEAYNPLSNTWTSVGNMPIPRTNFAADRYNDLIIVAGGQGASGPLSSVMAFNTSTGTWMMLPPMPTPRYGLDGYFMAAPTPTFYALGGIGSTGMTDVVEALDLTTMTWSTLGPMTSPRAFHAVARRNGYLQPNVAFVTGGINAMNVQIDTIQLHDPNTSIPFSNFFVPLDAAVSQHDALTFASGHSICLYFNLGRFGGLQPAPSVETEYLIYELSGFDASRFELGAELEDGSVNLSGEVPEWEGRSTWWFEKSSDNEVFEVIGAAKSEFPSGLGATLQARDEPAGEKVVWYRLVVEMADGLQQRTEAIRLRLDGVVELAIGPVPVRDELRVLAADLRDGETATWSIADMQGRVLKQGRKAWSGDPWSIDGSGLYPGVYHLLIQGEKGRQSKMFYKY